MEFDKMMHYKDAHVKSMLFVFKLTDKDSCTENAGLSDFIQKRAVI
jgi:hypothetical protein